MCYQVLLQTWTQRNGNICKTFSKPTEIVFYQGPRNRRTYHLPLAQQAPRARATLRRRRPTPQTQGVLCIMRRLHCIRCILCTPCILYTPYTRCAVHFRCPGVHNLEPSVSARMGLTSKVILSRTSASGYDITPVIPWTRTGLDLDIEWSI
ncbi:hypothetical protein TNCV_3706881 [Trichonephila clavipes]|nr:hypothetical protein TNCV_3706881 [Trichonephila clavipes]